MIDTATYADRLKTLRASSTPREEAPPRYVLLDNVDRLDDLHPEMLKGVGTNTADVLADAREVRAARRDAGPGRRRPGAQRQREAAAGGHSRHPLAGVGNGDRTHLGTARPVAWRPGRRWRGRWGGRAGRPLAGSGPRPRRRRGDGAARTTGPAASGTPTLSRLGSGRPLSPALAGRMTGALGGDFSGVRGAHRPLRRLAAARSVDANAFTVGQHVYFGAGTLPARSVRRAIGCSLTSWCTPCSRGGTACPPPRALISR